MNSSLIAIFSLWIIIDLEKTINLKVNVLWKTLCEHLLVDRFVILGPSLSLLIFLRLILNMSYSLIFLIFRQPNRSIFECH